MSQSFLLSADARTSPLRRTGWPHPARRVLVLLAMALTAVASVVAGTAAPASASVTFTESPAYFPLSLPATVTPGPDYTVIPGGTFFMGAVESRRVSEQVDVSIDASNKSEIDNEIFCFRSDANGGSAGPELNRASAGTNNENAANQHLVWQLSMVIFVDAPGWVTCDLEVQTGVTGDNYHMTVYPAAVPGDPLHGTWMGVSSQNAAGAMGTSYATYHGGTCTPADIPTDPGDAPCQYFGGEFYEGLDSNYRPIYSPPINPPVADIMNHPLDDRWVAMNDATAADVIGTFQLTTCPSGSHSCNPNDWANLGEADVSSYLELDQLNADGSVCQVNTAYGSALGQSTSYFVITNDVHHMPLSYHLTAPVSQNCGGSRAFQLDLHLQWLFGNTVKIDGGNINLVNSVRATTTTVPPVVGSTDAQASAAFQAAQLSMSTTRVMSPSPFGTVLSENSPGGTVEPVGSTVQVVESSGQVPVPYVLGWDYYSAEQAITNAGLNYHVSYANNCDDPNNVQVQDPSGGVPASVGSTVNIQVSTCTSGGGGGGGGSGGGGGGGGSGNPILPK